MNVNSENPIETLANRDTFDAGKAVQFWKENGSASFSKAIVYQTGLSVDWLTNIVDDDEVLKREDFFAVAHGHWLQSREMIICTWMDSQKIEAVLTKDGLNEERIDEMLRIIRLIQHTAALQIQTRAHVHVAKPEPGRVPEDVNHRLH